MSASDFELDGPEQKTDEADKDAHKALFDSMKEVLGDKVKDIRLSKRLKSHPVCLTSEGGVSIEMEKVLKNMPSGQGITAQKILELNGNHEVFAALKAAQESAPEKVRLYTQLPYNQALLMEGLSVEDPLAFSNDICKLMK